MSTLRVFGIMRNGKLVFACAEAVEDETSLWKEKENAVENLQGAHFVELLEVLQENIAPDLSQFCPGRRCSLVNALTEAVVEMKVNEQFDLESDSSSFGQIHKDPAHTATIAARVHPLYAGSLASSG